MVNVKVPVEMQQKALAMRRAMVSVVSSTGWYSALMKYFNYPHDSFVAASRYVQQRALQLCMPLINAKQLHAVYWLQRRPITCHNG